MKKLKFIFLLFLVVLVVHSKSKGGNQAFNRKKEECYKIDLCSGFSDNVLALACVYHCMSEECFRSKIMRQDGKIPEFGQIIKYAE